jgi:hypothetical protein
LHHYSVISSRRVEVDGGKGLRSDVIRWGVKRLKLIDNQRSGVEVTDATLLARMNESELRAIPGDAEQLPQSRSNLTDEIVLVVEVMVPTFDRKW